LSLTYIWTTFFGSLEPSSGLYLYLSLDDGSSEPKHVAHM